MKTNLIKFFTFIIFTSVLLNSCGIYKRSDIKDNPVSDKDAKIPKPQWHKASSENISNYSQTLNDLINKHDFA